MEETVKEWIALSDKLKSVKAAELEARGEIAAHILQGKIKGAKKGTIGVYTLTATAKLNLKLDKDELKAIWEDLSKLEKQAVKFTPGLIAAEYRKVPADSILHQTITSKPGTPGLELKAVKEV